MNISYISDIYQATRGLILAGMVRVNPKTAMKITIKILSVIVITVFLFGIFSGVAEAQTTSQPIVVTNGATQAASNIVVLNGLVDPRGVSGTTAWFEWGTSSSAPYGNITPSSTYGNGSVNFSYTISNLSSNTNYYYRAVAQNSNGTVYGQTYQFFVSDGGTYTYTGSGGVIYVGSMGGISSDWGNMTYPNWTSNVNYNNTYGYNTGGCNYNCAAPIYYGNTWGSQPIIYTYSPNVSGNSVTLNGYVNPSDYSSVTRWFEWGTNQYSLSNSTSKNTQSYIGAFNDSLVNLSANTIYYYRAVAQTSSGIVYGQVFNFTTDTASGSTGSGYISNALYNYGYSNTNYNYSNINFAPETAVVTNSADVLSDTMVKLNGVVVLKNNASQTNIWFEWGTTNSLGNTTKTKIAGNNPSVIFSDILGNLSSPVTYYYRAVAQNQYGIFRGDIVAFRTAVQAPAEVASVASNTVVNYVSQPTTSYKIVTVNTGASKTSLVKVSVLSDNNRVCRGDFEVFTVTYTNTSSQTLKDVVLRVELPSELKYQDSSKGYFSGKDNILIVDIGTLSPNENGQIVVKATVAGNPTAGREIVTTANVVYTTPSGSQDEVVSYTVGKADCAIGNTSVALSLWGNSFFPNTFSDWLLLIIVILALVMLSRNLYGTYAVEKENKEAVKKS